MRNLVGDKVKKGMMGAQGYLDATGGFLYRKGMEKSYSDVG